MDLPLFFKIFQIFMCKKNKNAFSLIELVVVIGLITFIALTATSLNFQ